MPMESGREKATLGQKLNVAVNLAVGVSVPLMLVAAREGTVGTRRLLGVHVAVGYFVLGVFSASDLTGLMAWVFWLGVLSYLVHRVRSARATGVHSHDIGESRLDPLVGHNAGWYLTGALAVLGGVGLAGSAPAAGWWFELSGATTILAVGHTRLRQRWVDQDVIDSQIDAAARAERLRGTRPW